MSSVASLASRLDRFALDQLRAECARLAAENERLRDDYHRAAADADWWRDEAIRMQDAFCDETGATPGLTIAGHLVAVPAIEARP